MTTQQNAPEAPRIDVTLRLDQLDQLARFTTYVRAEPINGAAEGFGIEGAVMIIRTISRDAWEELGCPVELPITLHVVTVGATS